MANAFSKEEIVFFEDVIAGFDPNNITARQVQKFAPPGTEFERSANRVWRPTPYISTTTENLTISTFPDMTQLAVPSELNVTSNFKNVPFNLNAVELRDPLQRQRKAESAALALSALVDRTIATQVAQFGSLFIKNGSALGSYEDVAQAEEQMSIRDVPITMARTLIMNPRDYNNVAANLANRDAPPMGVSLTAFERSRIPTVATFDSFKANFQPTQAFTAATGSYQVNGANQDHDPVATDANGNNVDNRYQLLVVSVGAGTPAIGDAFTIAGVNAISMINKNDTGELQKFRIVGGPGGVGTAPTTTNWTITPAIIAAAGGGGAQANIDYANVDSIPANTAAITFLNTGAVNQPSNIFFANDAVEIVHGSLSSIDLDGAGVATMRMSTDSGIDILFAKGAAVGTLQTDYRLTMWIAGNVLVPQMCGNLIQ